MRIEKFLLKRSSASSMYAQHNICNFESTIRKSIYMYGVMQKLENSNNSIICALYNSYLARFVIWRVTTYMSAYLIQRHDTHQTKDY